MIQTLKQIKKDAKNGLNEQKRASGKWDKIIGEEDNSDGFTYFSNNFVCGAISVINTNNSVNIVYTVYNVLHYNVLRDFKKDNGLYTMYYQMNIHCITSEKSVYIVLPCKPQYLCFSKFSVMYSLHYKN